ncbi:Proteasome subunit alpha type-7-like [Smittium mucronatum]|uniref:Proteasome subunit alpha type n=1 Tax=Smittium mucronatum TaxID=133383 RepID=A0A1R0H1Z3_9FUNG|nr:Proteasome subunit alpha type-7-like [Smittium mucronatum]
MSYDRALTVFSPDGHLFQVDYAQEAVRKGACAVGVRGKDSVVLGVERKSALKLQDPRTFRKIHMLDEHVFLASAGLSADSRVLVDKARVQCQSHKLTVEDPVTTEYITRYIAGIEQKYTQSGGRRPFGVSCLIAGVDPDHRPFLFQTDPSGNYYEWSANAIGRSSDVIREYLEKNFVADLSESDATKLTIKALMEVVQSGANNIEIIVLKADPSSKFGVSVNRLDIPAVKLISAEIAAEKAELDSHKKKPSAA